ncbi:MAG: hypothetical protein GY940_20420, partial [bacterium]|nr:hypothetical protein [bacterium]
MDPEKQVGQYNLDIWGLEENLPQVTVNTIIQTRDGYIWLGTAGGLVRFDGVRFKIYDKRRIKEFSSNVIQVLYEDRSGNLWIGTGGGGVILMKDNEFHTYRTAQGLADDIVNVILECRNGNLCVGTAKGLSIFKDGKFETLTITGLENIEIVSIYESRDNSLWIGTRNNGLKCLKNGKPVRFKSPDIPVTGAV